MTDKIGEIKQSVFGIVITSSNIFLSISWFVTTKVLAPRVITSWILLTVFSTKLGFVKIHTTVDPISNNAIRPCYNSPDAKL